MESGLEGRNNQFPSHLKAVVHDVSMESGLEGRNNRSSGYRARPVPRCLNGVRPRRPEQFGFGRLDLAAALTVSMESGLEGRNNARTVAAEWLAALPVSMESGLEGRNNHHRRGCGVAAPTRLNGVRPRRPEQ